MLLKNGKEKGHQVMPFLLFQINYVLGLYFKPYIKLHVFN